MKYTLASLVLFLGLGSQVAMAQAQDISSQALLYVPGGQVVVLERDEVKVQTTNGTIVEVEFTRKGVFEEASGKNASSDNLTPPNALVPLATALQGLQAAGKQAAGEWSLESSLRYGWHYEFDGYENGVEMEYIVDATTGAFVKAIADN
ncbi:MAG: PepSY domain-containing protein [Bdellovibrionaceae bacterium]|nr:PepSY domain-containing protein [Pseudobdellovibrionaceae bacterium]